MNDHKQGLRPGESEPGRSSLDREAYLADPSVKAFMDWLENDLREPGSFLHRYRLVLADKEWDCEGLFKAYQHYWRPFRFDCPVHKRTLRGENFVDSYMHLNRMAEIARDALRQDNDSLLLDAIRSVLLWGRIAGPSRDRVLEPLKADPKMLLKAMELDLGRLRLGDDPGLPMSVGWSYVYALVVDDFIPYDGRVGAGLGLLARLFSQKGKLGRIPEPIRFSFASSRVQSGQAMTERRNPGQPPYTLPRFTGRPKRHWDDAVKASWLMKDRVSRTASRFALIPQVSILDERLIALQAALYMIGYDLRDF